MTCVRVFAFVLAIDFNLVLISEIGRVGTFIHESKV